MSDTRLGIIDSRLENVKKIIAVSSGKGGVGKSVVASALALSLSKNGYEVGLFDLDFTSPSTHVILGIKGLFPQEKYGIIPPLAYGLRYMSITYYSLDKPAPLRGTDVSEAIIELLAITRWEDLDYLIIDMPPGIGDAVLDMIRLIKGINFLIITTPSKIAYETVKKLLKLLSSLKISVLGIVENMILRPSSYVKRQVSGNCVSYLGSIKFDPELEDTFGNVEKFVDTEFFNSVSSLISKIE